MVQQDSIFPTKLYIINYNVAPVHFYTYSTISSLKKIFNNIQPNSYITLLIPNSFTYHDDISIIAASTQGGIQGTILVNNVGNVRFVNLFGQEALPFEQSIGIFKD
jgi:hypothetical protein